MNRIRFIRDVLLVVSALAITGSAIATIGQPQPATTVRAMSFGTPSPIRQAELAIASEPAAAYPPPGEFPQADLPPPTSPSDAYPGPGTLAPAYPTLIPTLAPPTPASTPIPEDVQRALDYVAQRYGIPLARLRLAYQTPASSSLTGRTYLCVLAEDTASGQQYGVAVDLKTKATMSNEEMETIEREARIARYGKLEPELYELLQTKGAEEQVPVFIWFTSIDFDAIWKQLGEKYPGVPFPAVKPGDPSATGGDRERAMQILADYEALLDQAHLQKEQSLTELLRSWGHEVLMYSGIPSIAVTLKKSEIEEIASRDDVSAIYLGGKEPVLEIESAVPASRVPAVWNRGLAPGMPFDNILRIPLSSGRFVAQQEVLPCTG